MANDKVEKKKKKYSNIIPIKDLMFHCLRNWYWFVISLGITLGAAAYIIKSTPPQYMRYAEILIKESGAGGGNGAGSTFKELGNSRTSGDASHEMIALTSVDNMKEAIRRLGLEFEFKGKGTFYDGIIYKDRPFRIKAHGLHEWDVAKFTAKITSDNTVTLKEFSINGESLGGHIVAHVDSITATPLGQISIVKTPSYNIFKHRELYIEKHNIDQLANSFCSNLKTALTNEETSIVRISIKDVSTARATDILNTIIEIYNESWIAENNFIVQKTAEFIKGRAEEIKQELEAIDNEIAEFRSDKKLSSNTKKQLLSEAESSRENEKLLSLNHQLALAKFIKEEMKKNGSKEIIPANTGIAATNIESLIGSYNAKLLARNKLIENSSENHPVVKDHDKEIEAMYASIKTAINSHIKDIEKQIKDTNKEIEKSKSVITTTTHSEKELQTLIRQQKVKNALYLFLLQKLEETELSKEFSPSNNRVLVSPTGSNKPVEPKQKPIIMLALTIGFLLPVTILFIRIITNKKVRGRRDLEDLNVPFIGEIPQYKEGKKLFANKKVEEKKFIVKGGSRNIINEAFRVMRTNFEFMNDKEKTSNVILTTSFNPGSGKTFLTMNLGAALAIKGAKVLVIDGDLRRASASEYIHSTSVGISDYLSGGTTNVNEIITTETGYENLHVITVGTPPPNPTELLNSKHFEQLIEAMRERYNYILIDCPPIEIVADTQIIEKYCDRTLFVVRAGLLRREMLDELQDIYDEKRFKGIAVVLNGTYTGQSKYSYKYGYSYSYGYGYGYGYHYHQKK